MILSYCKYSDALVETKENPCDDSTSADRPDKKLRLLKHHLTKIISPCV